jgi:hypothetical protein
MLIAHCQWVASGRKNDRARQIHARSGRNGLPIDSTKTIASVIHFQYFPRQVFMRWFVQLMSIR